MFRSHRAAASRSVPVRFSLGALVAAVAAFASPFAPGAHAQKSVAWIEMEGVVAERPNPFAMFATSAKPTLREYVDALRRLGATDASALVLRLREPALNVAQVEELGAAIGELRKSGKTVHVFTEIYTPATLLLASYADEVILQAGGAVSMPGLYMEEMFLADTLAWVGLKPDFVQVGDYKGASEAYMNSKPSEAWEQNISQLLDGMYGVMIKRLREGRRLEGARLERALEGAWFADGEEAVNLGLVDRVMDRLDLEAHLEQAYGADHTTRTDVVRTAGSGASAAAGNPFAIFEALTTPQRRTLTRDTIAVLHIDGPIVDGESAPAGLLGGASVGSLTIRKALAEIENEPKVRGVVVRINSPGGSAIASESIWIGLRRVAEKKPVWVSVGTMAASGGYYIAVGGDKVYVNPSSIVGSIGVVGGKLAMGGLYEKVKVNIVPRARGPRASMMSTVNVWTEAERALVRERMVQVYDLFVERVRAGRPAAKIEQVAEGRLFTGDRALAMGMADTMGTMDDAVRDMAATFELRAGAYDVVDYPAPKSIDELLEDMLKRFGGFGAAAGGGVPTNSTTRGGFLGGPIATEFALALRELVGPTAWPAVRDALHAILQLRDEPVLLTAPRVLVFK